MRRNATILLHWSVLILLMLLLAAGTGSAVLSWLFGVAGLAMCSLAVVFGLLNGPGPALAGTLRRVHPWAHRGMYLFLGICSVSVLAARFGLTLPGPAPRELLIGLLGAGLLHGIFNLWRSSALNDGALRRMLPGGWL
ncbi:hypothetical protein [uncultured Roseobacter sp.]|uniref:hypothetical protein n=1 Tax=uncultured Roseobacter sp. TaxID=114847 RepID=UPI0026130D62|nr:hypothetical protein [uncultured Roseobacter sp.]